MLSLEEHLNTDKSRINPLISCSNEKLETCSAVWVHVMLNHYFLHKYEDGHICINCPEIKIILCDNWTMYLHNDFTHCTKRDWELGTKYVFNFESATMCTNNVVVMNLHIMDITHMYVISLTQTFFINPPPP